MRGILRTGRFDAVKDFGTNETGTGKGDDSAAVQACVKAVLSGTMEAAAEEQHDQQPGQKRRREESRESRESSTPPPA